MSLKGLLKGPVGDPPRVCCWGFSLEQVSLTAPTWEDVSTCCGSTGLGDFTNMSPLGELGGLTNCKDGETEALSSRDGVKLGKVPLPVDCS